MRFAVIYGTRPEAVKLSPLIPLLDHPTIIASGQHTDLLVGTPAEGVLRPTVALHLASDNNPLTYLRRVEVALHQALGGCRAEAVIVQGDTATAYAGALAAHKLRLPIAHVEAGLRTGNLEDPWPEEGFRVAIDRLARWCFAPTDWAARNLELEPDHQDTREIHVTGNTGIDALYQHTRPVAAPFITQPRVLADVHRRESFGEPLRAIIHGLWKVAQQFPGIDFFLPIHPNPAVLAAYPATTPQNVYRISHMPAASFAGLLATSRAVLTDSGGVQEEAAALGIPCVIARDVTDRPESVDAGMAIVAGRTAEGIQASLTKALTYQLKAVPSHCFGDGKAAPRIARILQHQEVAV